MLQIPLDERPRERLLQEGVEALSLSELIAIILCTGTKGKSVLQLSQEIVSHFGSLKELLLASVEELMEIKGVGRAKAVQLKAAFGIALKSLKPHFVSKNYILSAAHAYDLIKSEFHEQAQEILVVILRDVKGALIHSQKVAIGTLSEVLIHPREVFHLAVRHKAHSLIIAHNHPSGDPSPSKRDLELTEILLQASQVMGIGLSDHLIVGAHTYVSLKGRGLLGLSTRY